MERVEPRRITKQIIYYIPKRRRCIPMNVHCCPHTSPPVVLALSQMELAHIIILFLEDPFEYYAPIFTCVPEVGSAIQIFWHMSITCYNGNPSHLPWFKNGNTIQWTVQITRHFVINFSPAGCCFLQRKSQHSVHYPFADSHCLCLSLGVHTHNKTAKEIVVVCWVSTLF